MIRNHEHDEALKNLAVALNVADVSKFENKSILWLEAATRLALGGAIVLDESGEISATEQVQGAAIWAADLLTVFEIKRG